jgi:OTU-like cysteine protease
MPRTLPAWHFTVEREQPDGACLFRAIARQVYGNAEQHSRVRLEIVDYNRRLHAEQLRLYFELSDPAVLALQHSIDGISGDVETYFQSMSQPFTYGDDIEIAAAQALYSRSIVIWHNDGRDMYVLDRHYSDISAAFPIILLKTGEHYDSITAIADISMASPYVSSLHAVSSPSMLHYPIRDDNYFRVLQSSSDDYDGNCDHNCDDEDDDQLSCSDFQYASQVFSDPSVMSTAERRRYRSQLIAQSRSSRKALINRLRSHCAATDVEQQRSVRRQQHRTVNEVSAAERRKVSRERDRAKRCAQRQAMIAAKKAVLSIDDVSTDTSLLPSSTEIAMKDVACQHCSAVLFEGETTNCCNKGSQAIQPLKSCTSLPSNDAFRQLLDSVSFMRDQFKYNGLFSFTALGASPSPTWTQPAPPSMLTMHGKAYHRIFDAHAVYEGMRVPITNHARLYMHDGGLMSEADNLELNASHVRTVQQALAMHNSWVRTYKHAILDVASNMNAPAAHVVFEDVNRRQHGAVLGDAPRHSSEIAALLYTETLDKPAYRSVYSF